MQITQRLFKILQLVQFAVIFVHAGQLFFQDCNYPMIYVWMIMTQSVLFIGLFINFYRKSYSKKLKPVLLEKEEVNLMLILKLIAI